MKKILVTGGAGFIGSNLTGELLAKGCRVTVYDNLSLGNREFIAQHFKNPNFRFIKADLLKVKTLQKAIAGHQVVFHLAANSQIEEGRKHTDIDLNQGIIATYNVLEAMRLAKIKEIVFASTSAVYGQAQLKPTPEDYGPLFPISLYGASKLACEGLITAFAHNFKIRNWIFRFANVVGDNGTHGVLIDFIRKLRNNPQKLEILGNGRQKKPYLYVKECVQGILFGYEHARRQINCFNLTCAGATSVDKITQILLREMGLKKVRRKYTGGAGGWRGDVPQVQLDATRLKKLGWQPRYSSEQAVKVAVKALLNQTRL